MGGIYIYQTTGISKLVHTLLMPNGGHLLFLMIKGHSTCITYREVVSAGLRLSCWDISL
jgi:hypothetical protein